MLALLAEGTALAYSFFIVDCVAGPLRIVEYWFRKAKVTGISMLCGQWLQYLHFVQPMYPHLRYSSRAFDNNLISVEFSVFEPDLFALSTFSMTCCIAFMPLRATETSG